MAVNHASAKAKPMGREIDLSGVEHAFASFQLRFSADERVRLYERLERFVAHKVPLDEAIGSIYARLARPKKGLFGRESRDGRRHVYERILSRLRLGKPFAEAAKEYLPSAEMVMVLVGEQSSNEAEGFRQARFVADVVRRMRGALVGALTYPAVLLALGCGFLVVIAAKFGPMMLEMAGDRPVAAWPLPSRMLYQLAELVSSYGIVAGVLAILLGYAVLFSLPRWHERMGGVRRGLDKFVPPYTIYREYQAASFLIAIGALVKASVPVDEALARIASISAPWVKWHLRKMLVAVRKGVDPGAAFNTGMLTDEVVGYIEDFNRAGGLDEALTVVGVESVEDSLRRVKRSSSVLGFGAMLLVVGMIVLIYAGMIAMGQMVYTEAQQQR